MSKRALPAAEISARPGVKSDILPSALNRWNETVHAAAEADDAASISILDVIGQDFWTGEGTTAKRVSAALRAIGKRDVVVNINSPGGDYFEGLAIYNTLREHPANVTVNVLGIAASAASVIAMAGDTVRIARAGFLMIHNTWVVAVGDRHALRDVADWLEPFDRSAVDIYQARSGLDAKEIGKMLDKEAWISGTDAVAKGFADSLLASDEVSTSAKQSVQEKPIAAAHRVDSLLAQMNIPRTERRALLAAIKGSKQDAAPAGTQDAALYAEVQSLLSLTRSM